MFAMCNRPYLDYGSNVKLELCQTPSSSQFVVQDDSRQAVRLTKLILLYPPLFQRAVIIQMHNMSVSKRRDPLSVSKYILRRTDAGSSLERERDKEKKNSVQRKLVS